MELYMCYQCGYTKETESLPEDYHCPLCDEPGSSFYVVPEGRVPRELINERADQD